MSLFKKLLMDKKIFEAEEEVEKFLEEQGVEPGSIAQRLEFDKSVFTQKEQVDDFLQAHLFSSFNIEEDDKKYSALFFDQIALVESTMKPIKIRDGVIIVVGILRPMSDDNPILFNVKEKDTIKLSADIPYLIELAKVVDGFHHSYGKVQITKEHLKKFKENFDNKVYGVDVSIDFDHETREAAGWVKEVFLSDDEDTLLGLVKWTPKGALSLSEREFRYFSPEFSLNWTHPHNGINYGPVLMGGGLVNRPFLKMNPIVELKDKNRKGANEMESISLKDHEAVKGKLEKEISDLKLSENTFKNKAKDLEAQVKQLSDENKSLKDEKVKAEKESKHQKLFDEGKINKAQLDALNEGKEMYDVLSLSEKMNSTPQGTGGTTTTVQLSVEEKALCAKMGMSEEDFVKYNKEAE